MAGRWVAGRVVDHGRVGGRVAICLSWHVRYLRTVVHPAVPPLGTPTSDRPQLPYHTRTAPSCTAIPRLAHVEI